MDLKTILLVVAVAVIASLLVENRDLKEGSRKQQIGYERFLSQSVKGQKLKDTIQPGTLGVVLDGNEAIVCGIVSTELSSRQKP